MTLYDRIGTTYGSVRQADPRLAKLIWEALGDARTVVNVGAGAGSYEPPDRDVTAVEPSAVMIAQRAPDAAPAVQASAEQLPFDDDSFDAVMAIRAGASVCGASARRAACGDGASAPLPCDCSDRALEQLRRDLGSGAWDERYGHLRTTPELDVGLRLVCAEL